jgi:membrane-bound lytic murein transglycosylase F
LKKHHRSRKHPHPQHPAKVGLVPTLARVFGIWSGIAVIGTLLCVAVMAAAGWMVQRGMLVSNFSQNIANALPPIFLPTLRPPRETGEVVILVLAAPNEKAGATRTAELGDAKSAALPEREEYRQAGFEHDLALLFARELGAAPRFISFSNHEALWRALRRGQGHFAAAGLVANSASNPFTNPVSNSVAYPATNANLAPASATQAQRYSPAYRLAQFRLVGLESTANANKIGTRRVAVVAGSPAQTLVRQLLVTNPKTEIITLPEYTSQDALLKNVVEGNADFALVENTGFAVARRVYTDIAGFASVGKPMNVAWALADARSFDADMEVTAAKFFQKLRANGTLDRLEDRYYGHLHRIGPADTDGILARAETLLPDLQPFFLEAETATGIDWRFLAALAYQESQWDPKATSPTGVRGIMMLTEETASRMGVADRLDPRQSILGGAKYLSLLKGTIPSRIIEPDRTWLALAAYNQGYGHLEDARILAARLKLNPDTWLAVKKAYSMMQQPEVTETLKHGACRGEEAIGLVEAVRNYHEILENLMPPGGASATVIADTIK